MVKWINKWIKNKNKKKMEKRKSLITLINEYTQVINLHYINDNAEI